MASKKSPIGGTTEQARRRRAATSSAYRAEQQRLAQFEDLARLVIEHRALRISQQELARRVGTSHSAISRLESGRHKTSVETLQRVAKALEVSFVLSFESGSRNAPPVSLSAHS